MRQTSRDAGVIHPNSGPRRLWDFCAALVAVAMVLNPNVNVMGSAFFVADAALNLHTGYVDRGGTLILRRGRIMALRGGVAPAGRAGGAGPERARRGAGAEKVCRRELRHVVGAVWKSTLRAPDT